MNYFLTQCFVNKIKRNKMAIYNNETDMNIEMYNKVNEMDVVRERYMVSQDNERNDERNVDAAIDRIMETLERINTKLDKLNDVLANTKSKAVVPRVYK